jgi:hypothetical protein
MSEADFYLVNHVSLLGGEGYSCCMVGTTLSYRNIPAVHVTR